MSANPLLSIEGLTASVDEKTILHNVNLNVAAGETHVLMGPNGAGKSTLGHLVMGDPVYTVNDGRIVFDGQDITELTTDKRSRAGLFLSFQAPVEIPGVPLSSFLRASIAGRPGLEMKGKEFRRRVIITVVFDENREAEYPFSSLDELELAYAITIHKSQGSEYPAVVLPLLSGPPILCNRNLLYTAITRAQKCVAIAGRQSMVEQMIHNETEQKRYSGLNDCLKEGL